MTKDCSECPHFDVFHTSRACHDCKPWKSSKKKDMTREEATELLKQYNLYSPTKQIEQAVDMAIEALSQPIVVKCYEIDNDRVYCSPEMADKIYRALHEDTNVQNMHRGEWIDKEIPCNPYPPVFCVECSECGYRVGRETFQENTFNYCPNCGARMKGGDDK